MGKKDKTLLDALKEMVIGVKPMLGDVKNKVLVRLFKTFVIAKEEEIRTSLAIPDRKNVVKKLTTIFKNYLEEIEEDEEDEEEEEEGEETPDEEEE